MVISGSDLPWISSVWSEVIWSEPLLPVSESMLMNFGAISATSMTLMMNVFSTQRSPESVERTRMWHMGVVS